MADLLDHDDTVEQVHGGGEGHRRKHWMDSGVRVLLAEATAIIADRLGRQDTPESEMLAALDGVPMSIVLEAANRLGVTVRGGVWRVRKLPRLH
jgi:hypothetical protein